MRTATFVLANPFQSLYLALPKISQKVLTALGLFSIVVMAGLFLWQNSVIVSKTYLLQFSQNKLTELKKENTHLQLTITEGSSLGSLEKQISQLSMEETDKVDYIKDVGNSVVIKK